ncbi:MAG: DNA polymerase III subunit delta' [Lachnospiraceae bacterium]|nr:DNA polymerase III subunit delta' [Lachnospiraceae bacterium]
MSFSDIQGQTDIKAHLQSAIKHNKFSHAYIISGEKDSGKMMLAEAFAQTILCEEGGDDACGECQSCHQAIGHNHPDIHYVMHEKPNSIGIDDIRTQLNNDIVIKPYSSKYKIYIVDEAEKMTEQAQNALLKTIEEPPEYGVIFLLTTSATTFLPTILSRCVLLDLKPVNQEIIKRELMHNHGMPDYQAEVCAAFSQGNFGKAIKLAESQEFNELKNTMVDFVKRAASQGVYEINEIATDIVKSETVNIQDYLDLMTIWFKDVLLYKSTGDNKLVTYQDEIMIIKRQSAEVSFGGLENIFKAIDTCRKRLNANVNNNLTVELLLMEVKENMI